MKLLLRVVQCTLALLSFGAIAQAQDKIVSPPWSVVMGDYIMVGVVWDEATVRQALPAGINPMADLSGGIAIYQATGGFGAGPYHGAYAFVNVEGFDSTDGTKGRWIMQGAYGPNERLSAMIKELYGWPVRNGSTAFEETVVGKRGSLTVAGNQIYVMDVKISPMPCAQIAGVANYVGKGKSAGKFTLNEIPFAGEWCGGEPITMKVVAPSADPFSKFVPTKVVFAGQFKKGVVAFSKPIAR